MPEGDPAAGGTGEGTGAAGGTGGQNTDLNPDKVGAGGAGEGGAGTGKTFDESYVKQLRDEAAKNRSELKKVQEALKAHEDAKLSDTERSQKRLAELEALNADLQAKQREHDLHAVAARAGASAPEVVAKLIDPAAENVGAEMDRIKKLYPMLFGKAPKGSADGGNNQPPPVKEDMNLLIRKAAGRA